MSVLAFLIPETTLHANGTGEPLDLGGAGPVLVTLGVLETVEQESLLLSIEGSPDGVDWRPEPLVSFPERFYPGVIAVYIDPAGQGIRHLRANWKLNRWGRGDKTPSFRLYLFVEAV